MFYGIRSKKNVRYIGTDRGTDTQPNDKFILIKINLG